MPDTYDRVRVFRDDPGTAKTHTAFSGKGVIGGTEYYLDVWADKPKTPGAKPYLSIRFKPTGNDPAPRARSGHDHTPAEPAQVDAVNPDDLIPF